MRTTISAAICLSLAGVAIGSDAGAAIRKQTHIPAQPLEQALRDLSKDRDLHFIFVAEDVKDHRTPGVTGELTHIEALSELLKGTGLTYLEIDEQTISILPKTMALEEKRGADKAGSATRSQARSNTSAPNKLWTKQVRVAQSEEDVVKPESVANTQELRDSNHQKVELEEVLVTGTNIRNVTDEFSPVISVDREFLDNAGYATVGQYIAQLPQNFTGGTSATPDRGALSFSGIGANAVNLRAMGTGATLTLLNGRRMAASGTSGTFVDISGIPTAAIDRVDVLTDGASAIYGSDAIAGVVNFVLRKDYNGGETRLRFGTKDGDATDYQIGQTFGVSTGRGRALLSYEYASEEPLDANDRSFTAMMDDPNEILPGGYRNSAFFSGGLTLGDEGELFLELNYSDRHSRQDVTATGIYRQIVADVQNYGGAAGATFALPGGWRGEVSGSASITDFRNIEYRIPPILGDGGAEMWNDEYIWSADAKADGGLFDIWGGTVRAVIGAQYRKESHDGASDFLDEVGVRLNQEQLASDRDREIVALYTEIYAPLISEMNSVAGVRSLALSLAGRYEEYSDFGTTLNPKFGVLWTPIDGFTLRSSYGKSFRAPPMYHLVDMISEVSIVDYIDPGVPSGRSVAARVGGFSSDLGPEESTSWSIGVDLLPKFAPGLNARVTYYDIEYTGRIAAPRPELDTSTLEFYDYPLPVERNVDLAQLQAWISQAPFGLFNYTVFTPTGSHSELEDVTVVLKTFPTNTSASRARGIDADASYNFAVGESRWMASVNANYILGSKDQFSPLRPSVKTYDRIFQPAELRMRGGLVWSMNALSAHAYANYVSSYDDNRVQGEPPRNVGDWLTFDASLQYDFDRAGATGFLSGTRATLSVRNLTNKAPPYVIAGLRVFETNHTAYDSANADPDGRTIALQISKKW